MMHIIPYFRNRRNREFSNILLLHPNRKYDTIHDMKLKEWLKTNMEQDELCAPEMEIGDAVSILKDELLGDDWCVMYPCNGKQALAEAVCSVVKKFGRPWYERIADI